MCCALSDLHFQSIRILCTRLIVTSDRVVLEKYIFGSILFNLKLNLLRDRMVRLCQVCTCISRNISVFCLQCTISCCYPGEQLRCHFQQGELIQTDRQTFSHHLSTVTRPVRNSIFKILLVVNTHHNASCLCLKHTRASSVCHHTQQTINKSCCPTLSGEKSQEVHRRCIA